MIESKDIYAVPVSTSRFLPEGEYVKLYAANGCGNLTIGQLANSISVRIAAAHEYRSVNVMNAMTQANSLIKAMSSVGTQILGNYYDWYMQADVGAATANYGSEYTPRTSEFAKNPTVRNFLIYECGIDAANVNTAIDKYPRRMSVFKMLKDKLDQATTQSQNLAITLKTCMNRRDVAYSTSTNVSKHYTSSLLNIANAMGKGGR